MTTDRTNPVTLPEALSDGGVVATGVFRLMPTVAGNDRSHLHFRLTLEGGTVQEFDADAPPMRPAGRYEVRLVYEDMKPYMRLYPVSIGDWAEGWMIEGEVFNPD